MKQEFQVDCAQMVVTLERVFCAFIHHGWLTSVYLYSAHILAS